MKHDELPRAACANLPTIFQSTLEVDHRIAVGYCLGDDDRPICPMFAACQAATPAKSDRHDGTWAGRLFKDGRRVRVGRSASGRRVA